MVERLGQSSQRRRARLGALLAAPILLGAAWAGGAINTGNHADARPATAAKMVSFKKDVQTIFTAHCAACHLNGVASGGLNLGNYAGLVKGGNIVKGSVFVAKNHAKSVIWQITSPKGPWPGGQRMPLGGPYLSTAQIATIAAWIDQGAKNN